MSQILTFTGIYMDPTDAKPDEIKIVDIAHALSLLCRGNGQLHDFYSVAQHSYACFEEARARGYSPAVQFFCLLHDASEAYLSDVTRPIKEHLPTYRQLEQKLQAQIYDRFAGRQPTEEEAALIRDVDDAMLYWEFEALMHARVFERPPELYSTQKFGFVEFRRAEDLYLTAFQHLIMDVHKNED